MHRREWLAISQLADTSAYERRCEKRPFRIWCTAICPRLYSPTKSSVPKKEQKKTPAPFDSPRGETVNMYMIRLTIMAWTERGRERDRERARERKKESVVTVALCAARRSRLVSKCHLDDDEGGYRPVSSGATRCIGSTTSP